MPLSLTDKYDTRAKRIPIRAGEPLNLIVNRIYIRDNGQRPWLLENSSDIAVVVTVDDGRSPEPKHVLVAYEQNIGSRVKIPVDDLVAYSTDTYADEPVRIEVTVLAMYSVRNRTYSQVLAAAAGIGAALSPAYAPAISVASQVGSVIINSKQDRMLAKFTFELYPWKPGKARVTEGLGVPRVAYGQYLLLNAPNGQEIGDPDSIHLDFSLIPYRVSSPADEPRATVSEGGSLPQWPMPLNRDPPREPLVLTYVVLTVDKSSSRLNHRLPRHQTEPKVMQRTADFHHQIAHTRFPQSAHVLDDAAALDAAVDVLDADPAPRDPSIGRFLPAREGSGLGASWWA